MVCVVGLCLFQMGVVIRDRGGTSLFEEGGLWVVVSSSDVETV